MMGRMHVGWVLAAALGFVQVVCAATPGPVEDPWAAFDLRDGRAGPVVVRVQPALEHHLPTLEAAIAEAMARRERFERSKSQLAAEREAVLARVHDWIGEPTAPQTLAEMAAGWEAAVGVWPPTEGLRIIVVSAAEVKERLRAGHAIPDFRYDARTDSATYSGGFSWSTTAEAEAPRPIVLPIDDDAQLAAAAEAVAMLLGPPEGMPDPRGVVIHEILEMAVLMRLRPSDPYFRWFSDGVANALAIRLLRERFGEDAAAEFAARHDPADYADLEKGVNLRYWMGVAYDIDAPIEGEGRRENARYTFATVEAERLIAEHGVGVVRRILDEAANHPSTGSGLIAAIDAVTGGDTAARLKRYDDFRDLDTAIADHAAAYNAALDANDHAEALRRLARVHELVSYQVGEVQPGAYISAAELMRRLGKPGDGVVLYERLLRQTSDPQHRREIEERLARYRERAGL